VRVRVQVRVRVKGRVKGRVRVTLTSSCSRPAGGRSVARGGPGPRLLPRPRLLPVVGQRAESWWMFGWPGHMPASLPSASAELPPLRRAR